MFEQTFKNIDDVLWKEAGCATELDYTEQTSWILFLKYLDDLERANEQRAELQGKKYQPIIDRAHRWFAKLAAGGAAAQIEASRMVTEKAVASFEAATTLATGGSVRKVVKRYRARVTANRLRLSARSR